MLARRRLKQARLTESKYNRISMNTDHYKVLGLSRAASTSQIKAQYKLLAKKHHPDVSGDTEVMSQINLAYNVLSDPKRRFTYDKSLALEDFDEVSSRSKEAPRRAPQASSQPSPIPAKDPFHTFVEARRMSLFGMFAFGAAALGVGLFIFIGILHASNTSASGLNSPLGANSTYPGVSGTSQSIAGSQNSASTQSSTTTTQNQSICDAQNQLISTQIASVEQQITGIKHELALHSERVRTYDAQLKQQLSQYESQLSNLNTKMLTC